MIERKKGPTTAIDKLGSGALDMVTGLATAATKKYGSGATANKSERGTSFVFRQSTIIDAASSRGGGDNTDTNTMMFNNNNKKKKKSIESGNGDRFKRTDERVVISALARLEQDSKSSRLYPLYMTYVLVPTYV
jgi:hypothetical protein